MQIDEKEYKHIRELMNTGDSKDINPLIVGSNDWDSLIWKALHEFKMLMAKGTFDKKENKQYFNKIITVLFTNIYLMGYNRGKKTEELDELERMWNLPAKEKGID